MPMASKTGSMILTPYFFDWVGATPGSFPKSPTNMQTGFSPSTATPRSEFTESNSPVYCIIMSER